MREGERGERERVKARLGALTESGLNKLICSNRSFGTADSRRGSGNTVLCACWLSVFAQGNVMSREIMMITKRCKRWNSLVVVVMVWCEENQTENKTRGKQIIAEPVFDLFLQELHTGRRAKLFFIYKTPSTSAEAPPCTHTHTHTHTHTPAHAQIY